MWLITLISIAPIFFFDYQESVQRIFYEIWTILISHDDRWKSWSSRDVMKESTIDERDSFLFLRLTVSFAQPSVDNYWSMKHHSSLFSKEMMACWKITDNFWHVFDLDVHTNHLVEDNCYHLTWQHFQHNLDERPCFNRHLWMYHQKL